LIRTPNNGNDAPAQGSYFVDTNDTGIDRISSRSLPEDPAEEDETRIAVRSIEGPLSWLIGDENAVSPCDDRRAGAGLQGSNREARVSLPATSYRPRSATNDLKEVVEDHMGELFQLYDERFSDQFGPIHRRVRVLFERFIRSGDLHMSPVVFHVSG
jgi:hypothetical protein